MNMRFAPGRISLSKELNDLDRLALDFSTILRRQKVRHVFVAGYIAILFGRSRVSEDIDVLMEEVPPERFRTLWKALTRRFECHNASAPETAYRDFLVRFGSPLPVRPSPTSRSSSVGPRHTNGPSKRLWKSS